ncbi:ABC transporter permease [Sporosarcina sp. HYO08]|uniref:ABC transporter permease n=1 Tax=Sporosarcina sp. HYO08 TaxID=1759557 RepID=UPI0007943997|nr:ABC transporter permease [Sporosarcina sp. HYO08]KXH79289.1 hypothetical protein AU377_11960 [Sporosarcina sp. HYO08]
MKNLRDIWGVRFVHYMNEFQRYMKYVFTGHLAIVLVFTIGAGGYAYSEWLKEVPEHFPAALLTAIVIAAALCYSPPVTLLKQADSVYFLPLEQQLGEYMKRALRWSFFSQLPLPFILLIVALPLLSATGTGSNSSYLGIAVFIVVLKMIFVQSEFNARYVLEGRKVWLDRTVRFLLASILIWIGLHGSPLILPIIAVMIGLYAQYWKKRTAEKPFPYDHFIALEQNRMMRFYRFANYFTDVPHVKGSVSRRRWLKFLMTQPKFGNNNATHAYLVRRTFLRTDDIFWLWLRLTILSVLGALFIPFPIVVFIFVGSLAFASAVQIVHALGAGDEFRMDMLFPEKEDRRSAAVQETVRTVQWIQVIGVMIGAVVQFGLSLTPILIGAIVLIVSEATIRLTGQRKNVE